ncbi:DUF1822 family protein [Aerosakkonema funiforme]|uniref:DUF1822 family protein n=1 Tax=Aerosakkonema funiforme FACHB-1375 TaxID=2949571 RepID=A0A926VC15_9CYAN|nr:DUF1822 family protein [Aerosakkonema funiforme]MBD2181067.1 DUF1822 family protein [Aerosakkonema funiforme FACHB-1375]
MKLSIQELNQIYADQICLEFSSQDQDKAWPSENEYSNDSARWNAYLNRLCLSKLINWLAENTEAEVKVFPSDKVLPTFWEFVNGTAINIGKKRIVLIPCEANNTEEFCVPQEWVDIPTWAADYYLAVQIHPDDGWLRVWGYATHEQLKQLGNYDRLDRTYCLEGQDLIADLEVLWIVLEMGADEKAVGKPLPILSMKEAEKLVQQLSRPSPSSPRLKIDFEQWAALLENDTWRQQLYEQRRQQVLTPAVISVTPITATRSQRTMVNLSNWWQDLFESGWQAVEELFGTQETNLALAFRGRGSRRVELDDTELDDAVTIKRQIELLSSSTNEDKRKKTAKKLAKNLESLLKNDCNDREVKSLVEEGVKALVRVIRTTDNEETRWTAAEELLIIDPKNPATGKRRIKDLGMQLVGNAVALMVSILEKPQGKVAVLVRLYPMNDKAYLPPQLQLTILDDREATFLEAKARENDNFIQLKFSGLSGDRFGVKVSLGDASITEDFVI